MRLFASKSSNLNTGNLIVFSIAITLSLALVFTYKFIPSPFQAKEGEIASATIRSPRNILYDSQAAYEKLYIQTKENFPGSLKTNWSTGPHQKELLFNLLLTLTQIRDNNNFTALEKKNLILHQLSNHPISFESSALINDVEQIASAIEQQSNREWEYLKGEVLRLVDYLHQQGIMEKNIKTTKSQLKQFIQDTFTNQQKIIIERLLNPFLAVNVIEDFEKTSERLEKALSSLKKPIKSITAGDVIVEKGEKLTAETIEALEKLGFVNPSLDWVKALAFSLLAFCLGIITFWIFCLFKPKISHKIPALIVVAVLIILNSFLIRNILPEKPLIFYLLPFALTPLLLAVFVGKIFSFWSVGLLLITLATINADINNYVIFLTLSSFVSVLLVCKANRMYDYVKIGIFIALTNFIQLVLFNLITHSLNLSTLWQFLGISLTNGFLLAVFTMLAIMYLGNFFDYITHFQLAELANPNHPLLLKLSARAPGTYHHSVSVAELCQAAADALGVNTLLAKVYALYHDIGKLKQPEIFIENQNNFKNPLLERNPKTLVKKIISHVSYGVKLAKEYNIPAKILRAILTHHGTTKTNYLYQQVLKTRKNPEINEKLFTYPGSLPKNKEESILMLADGVEAAVRSSDHKDPKNIRQIIELVISQKINEEQFNQSKITISDLAIIKKSFYATLMGIYHPRLKYGNTSAKTNVKKKNSQSKK